MNQLDYVTHQKELLVKNLFTLNNIEACEEWLTAQCGRPIRFPKENISSPFRDSDDSGSLPRELLKHEWDFYDLLQSFGGHVTEDTTQQKELARYLRGL